MTRSSAWCLISGQRQPYIMGYPLKRFANWPIFTDCLFHSSGLKRPQATCFYRSTNFNEVNVGSFFKKLTTVYSRHGFQAKDIWNVDETGLVRVQKPDFLVATKGERRVGSITSAERGVLVTMALAGNALGNIIPPHFVFPRKKYLPHFIRGCPEGSIGTANGSGWMMEKDFVVFLQHFEHYTRATEESKVLLLLDNHSSHISIEAINFCRANGVVMLSFPPQCTHHLQPLDKSVYGPLKRFFNEEMDKWHRENPGQTITIYDLPQLLNNILLLAASPLNVKKGFKSTGIWPLNPLIFKGEDFLPASVTDRPPPDESLPGLSDAALTPPGPSDAALTPPGPSADDALVALTGPTMTINSEGLHEITLTLFPLSLQEEEIITEVREIDLISSNVLYIQLWSSMFQSLVLN
ncbi:uncharacterized protein LOC127630237 isoform X2 [Xyrauchen texanus]|uniref:uncharacterized protein LOC127630237 isoform X2 n=1 Tax=Xyrauchen texanus TaxID=154827 RepID=UPI002241E970|nr:uncharacterized protein LOC127630237 isoform X2 [Xyrauchen texanus]